ncbi:MAG: tRNA (adenosine(37)-N6)-threonylcarbamoyltransferase complex dimerization subunit type 1 TsaB [Hyphomicrobiaceae bacterium]
MAILALDTCLGAVSVAILEMSGAIDDERLTEIYEERATGHAERLVPMMADAMQRAGIAASQISCIAVTTGPGTFTGVRVGIAAARALAVSLQCPVVGTTCLAVLMHQVREMCDGSRGGRPVLIAVDARRGEAYVQLFGQTATDVLLTARTMTPAEAARVLGPRKPLVAGSAAVAMAEAFRAEGCDIEIITDRVEPHAAALARLAATLPVLDPVRPLYLRPPDAKPQGDKSLPRA